MFSWLTLEHQRRGIHMLLFVLRFTVSYTTVRQLLEAKFVYNCQSLHES